MIHMFQKMVQFASSAKGAKITLIAWLAIVMILSVVAPSSKEYSQQSEEGSVRENIPSTIAKNVLYEHFPTNQGLTALLVFHREGELTAEDKQEITALSEWLASDAKPQYIERALPYHLFPESVQAQMFSEDKTTLLFNLTLQQDLESSLALETFEEIRAKVVDLGFAEGLQFEVTGPAGIAVDTISIFRNADLVLMLATVGLIFVLLIIIYRSPLLAIIPLMIAAIVYGVVDRVLGLAGENGWFVVDGSAVSIMLVLLFAVLTDYSLFVFSRYREKLQKHSSKYEAMGDAMRYVSEPILFSGGTVLLAVLTLFTTVFKPYNHFAPVFSVAIVFILLAGLTLIPSIFALLGRKAFWPSIPKVKESTKARKGIWAKVSKLVTKRPFGLAVTLLVVLLIGAFNVLGMNFSFNLMKSFPEDLSSRQGFELLEEHYPAGELAPVTIILRSDEEIVPNETFLKSVQALMEELGDEEHISVVKPQLSEAMYTDESKLPNGFLAEDRHAVKLQMILQANPYDIEAIKVVEQVREQVAVLLEENGLSPSHYEVHVAGQTAEQVDVRAMNTRDMIVLFSLVIVFITAMLALQTRSILMAGLMMLTIVLSYTATLGFGWLIFHYLLGYEAISYRLPVYTFVFMVALGVDYNIMLVSRIKEEAKKFPWRQAVGRGIQLTGGVISSAGIILAATFAVLITQPLQELFLFGFTMAMGIILDTFLIRGVLLPSLLILTQKDTRKEKKQEVSA